MHYKYSTKNYRRGNNGFKILFIYQLIRLNHDISVH